MSLFSKIYYQASYRIKNIASAVIAFVLILLAYFLSISVNIDLYRENKALEQSVLRRISETELNNLNRKSEYLNKLIYNGRQESFQNALITSISNFTAKNNTVLTSFTIVSNETDELWQKNVYKVSITGSFVDILKTCFDLQNSISGGLICSFTFELQKDRSNKKDYLIANVYIQSISYETHK